MSDSMIERVARAITAKRLALAAEAMAGGAIGLGMDDDIGRELARSAIEEMRRPTEQMIANGAGYTDFSLPEAIGSGVEDYKREIAIAWYAMIETALAPHRPPHRHARQDRQDNGYEQEKGGGSVD